MSYTRLIIQGTALLEGERVKLCLRRCQAVCLHPPGPEPALEPHHGERGAVGQGQLHVHSGEPVWLHQPHLPPGCGW